MPATTKQTAKPKTATRARTKTAAERKAEQEATRRKEEARKAIEDRDRRIIDLRRAGLDYRSIAAQVGISYSQCYNVVEKYRNEAPRESAELLRQGSVEKLDWIYTQLAARLQKGDVGVAPAMLRVVESRAKFTGELIAVEQTQDLQSVQKVLGGMLESAMAFAKDQEPEQAPEPEVPSKQPLESAE